MLARALAFVIGFGIWIPALGYNASAKAAAEHHPDIRKAIAACQLAAVDLEDASHDFCGHREDALDATLNAINQLDLAIACDPNSSASQAAISMLASVRSELAAAASSSRKEHHPYIRKALAALNLAAIDLEDAAHDFCGHRLDALNSVNNAITQLELALSCDS